MKAIFSAVVALLAVATSAQAAQVVYVGNLDKSTGDQFETVYSGIEWQTPAPLELAQIYTVWNKTAHRYEQVFRWNGVHDNVASSETLMQVASSNLCNVGNGRACLVSENGKNYAMYSEIHPDGVKSV